MSDRAGCGFTIFAIVLILVIGITNLCINLHSEEYASLTVVEKSYSGEEDGFLVWLQDEDGTQYEFCNKDSLLHMKWDSSTVQGKLQVGSTYRIKTAGIRVPFLSMYPNIIKYEIVE